MYNNKSCRCGEIGRHDRLKIYCRKKRVGSSPTTGTKGYSAMLVKSMAFFLTTGAGSRLFFEYRECMHMRLKQIDCGNFSDVSALRPKKSQETYLPSGDHFLAGAYVNASLGYPDMCRAIYTDDDTLVGFTKIVYVPKNEKTYGFDDACMTDCVSIDRDHQNQGYGSAALGLMLAYVRDELDWDHDVVRLVCHENNDDAIRFFEHRGFNRLDTALEGRRHLWLCELSNQG